MTKKIIIAFAIAGAMASKGFSQANIDSLKKMKNEITLSIAPILFYGTGGKDYNSNSGFGFDQNRSDYRNNFGIDIRNTYRLMYKLYFKKSGIRLGITYNWISYSFYDNYYQYNNNQYIYGIENKPFSFPSGTSNFSDTTRSYLQYHLSSNATGGMSIGYELIIGKRKLKQFTGVDVNSSFYFIDENTTRVEEKLDSTLMPSPPFLPNYYYPQWRNVSEIPPIIYSKKSIITKIGFAPFYGIKYPISNRFSISMQTGFEYFFVNGKIKFVDDTGNEYFQNVKQSGLYAQSFISDISVIYKF